MMCYKHPERPAVAISLEWSLLAHLPVCLDCRDYHVSIRGVGTVIPMSQCTCDLCGEVDLRCELMPDGTDSGESDFLCRKCRES